MGSIITDEHPAKRAIVIEGVGPHLRLYCRYGMSAVEEGGAVDSLTWNPTAGDWKMHVPCDAELKCLTWRKVIGLRKKRQRVLLRKATA